jgi:hypothetical protein
MSTYFCLENLMGRDYLEDLDIDGCEIESSGSGQGPVMGSCEQGNGPVVSIKVGEFLD